VIVLENESASVTFGPSSPAPYLASTLRSQGAYLPNYYGIGHASNDNYIGMISGQAPNTQTQADCQIFTDFVPGTVGANGQADGTGCVYPSAVQTIAGQLDGAGKTWRDYNEDMGNDPSREPAQCAHPDIGSHDGTQGATATDQYATRHNPFVYFHSIIDDPALCDTHVVNFNSLTGDLASAATTPNYVFITPNLCSDGHDAPCANGDPGGLKQIDTFLRKWVPVITNSPAFKTQNGLLIVTFDEAASSDASSCCGEIPGPGSPMPGESGPGGGDVGAVLLSPCIAPGTVSQTPYNHYTMLRSVEDIFGLSHLAYADLPGSQSFGSDVFTGHCASTPIAHVKAPSLASNSSARPQVKVSWSASDGAGAGIASFTVQEAPAGSTQFKTLLTNTTRRSLRFTGKPGTTYQFRVTATDRAGLVSGFAMATTVFPTGTKIHGGHYHGPWRTVHERKAWQHTAKTCSAHSCRLTLTYTGRSIAVIGDKGPHGGRVRVLLDGHTKTINLHAEKTKARQVIFRGGGKSGPHKLSLKVLSGTVAVEGFGIRT
jgi:hypothetical protein